MSKIEWTDETWNPLAGCTRVSAGCDNCYAASMALRLEAQAKAAVATGRNPGRAAKYVGVATRNGHGVAAFNGTINLDYEALTQPYRWSKPRMVFVNSMSDLFHKNVSSMFIDQVFTVMANTPQHTYQVLTKRPSRMARWCSRHYPEPLANVWLGTSAEDQKTADERIPHLCQTPAAVRFLSCEPLLGPIDLAGTVVQTGRGINYRADLRTEINWIIVGGESGPRARPMHPGWVRSLRDQCAESAVPFFFKQWGEYAPDCLCGNSSPCKFVERPQLGSCGRMFRCGKKAAGRLLDGREWNEFPILVADGGR